MINIINGIQHKTCSKCKETKTIDNFYKHKSKKDGYSTWCRECKNSARRKRPRKDGYKYCASCDTLKLPNELYKHIEKLHFESVS